MTVLVASVMHTGTIFTCKLIQGVLRIPHNRVKVRNEPPSLPVGDHVLQAHFGYKPHEDGAEQRYRTLEALSKIYPTVVPIRDPVLSICSNRRKAPDRPADKIKKDSPYYGWEEFTRRFLPFRNAFYFPVDLVSGMTVNQRKQEIEKMVRYIGREPDDDLVTQWAMYWPMEMFNYHGLYPAKEEYLEKKVGGQIPTWAEVEKLKQLPFRSFLIALGYDLWWWPLEEEFASVAQGVKYG